MGILPEESQEALSELYEEVTSLLLKKIKDPPTEPYKTRYLTRNKLEEMKTLIVNGIDDASEDVDIRTSAMLGGIYYLLGTTAMEVEEMSTGEEHLTKCLSLLAEYEVHPDCIVILMATYNQLGILWSMRDDLEKALEYLKLAEEIYDKFKAQSETEPTHMSVLFTGKKKEDSLFFEKTRTLTLYFLAQVHTKLGNLLKAAQYCHGTLRRQLEADEYDKIDWALNAATMSQFLLEKLAFKQARHHLAAASHILELRETELDIPCEDEQHLADKEQLDHRKADVARCWIKYCIMLLTSSKKRLMAATEDDEALRQTLDPIPEELLDLWFESLDLTDYESKIRCEYILTFDDARPVFVSAKNWIDKATSYYTLTEHASDHIAIQQDLSQLYYAVSFFEEDEAKQCKIHKRRADLLKKIVDQVSPVHYVQACREIWFELGEIFITMMDLKPTETEHHRLKRNYLIKQGLDSLNSFIMSFKGLEDPEDAEIPKESVRPVLLAFIYCGRLFTKIYSPDKTTIIANNCQALNCYQFVVTYVEKHPEAEEEMESEVKACREMISMLPQMCKHVNIRT